MDNWKVQEYAFVRMAWFAGIGMIATLLTLVAVVAWIVGAATGKW